MSGTLSDLRHSRRGLWKGPAFVIVAALTLALGMEFCTPPLAIFRW
ncbi:MAG: hypothetical protein WB952_12840 [Terriglobales bacterium]